MCPRIVLSLGIVLFALQPAFAVEPVLLKESVGADANLGQPCPLNGNTNGTVANYRWYNVCSGYIWIFNGWVAGEGVGVRFGGPWESDEVDFCGATVKRVITYYRNVVPAYNQTVDVYVDFDDDGDGCPEGVLTSDLDIDPGLRWNCSDLAPFSAYFTGEVDGLIVRQVHDGGIAPAFATDGPFSGPCDPVGTPRSYYYGVNGSNCVQWDGPTERADNFLTWLILDDFLCDVPENDCCLPDGSCLVNVCLCACYRAGGVFVSDCLVCPTNAARDKSWGAIKGLFR